MITDQDIEKLKQVFATKEELNELKIDMTAFKNEILHALIKFKDEILSQIENLRADTTVDSSLHDQVDDHERRIEQLEKAVPA